MIEVEVVAGNSLQLVSSTAGSVNALIEVEGAAANAGQIVSSTENSANALIQVETAVNEGIVTTNEGLTLAKPAA